MDELVTRTLGEGRRVTLSLAAPLAESAAAAGLTLGDDRRSVSCNIDDVARDLPPLLQRFASSGVRVDDVHIDRPSLHAVFIALTGRELRRVTSMLKHMPMMLWMAWVSLKRDKVALLLTFALPIAFFSIFVMIFGGSVLGGDGMSKVKVALVDLDDSPNSQRFVTALRNEGGLSILTSVGRDEQKRLMTREDAQGLVKDGKVGVGVIIPKGFGETFPNFDFSGADVGDDAPDAIQILADKQRDPIAPQVVAGLMQKAAMIGAPIS